MSVTITIHKESVNEPNDAYILKLSNGDKDIPIAVGRWNNGRSFALCKDIELAIGKLENSK